MPDPRCPACRHTVPAGRWCNRCGAPLQDATTPPPGGAPSWMPRALAAVGAMVVLGGVLWAVDERPPPSTPSAQVDTGVVVGEDARPAPPVGPMPTSTPSTPTIPAAPPQERTNVVCSDLRPRSVPTAELRTDEPGELVQLGDRTCVVMRPEGVTVP